jgi:hypothetical protein
MPTSHTKCFPAGLSPQSTNYNTGTSQFSSLRSFRFVLFSCYPAIQGLRARMAAVAVLYTYRQTEVTALRGGHDTFQTFELNDRVASNDHLPQVLAFL